MATNAPAFPADLSAPEGQALLDMLPPFLHESIHIREVFEATGNLLDILDNVNVSDYLTPIFPDPTNANTYILSVWERQLGLSTEARVAAGFTTAERAASVLFWLPWADIVGLGAYDSATDINPDRLVPWSVATIAYMTAWPAASDGLVSVSTSAPGELDVQTPTAFPSGRLEQLTLALDRMAPAHVQVNLTDQSARWTVTIH